MNSVRDFQKLEQDNALQKAKSRVIEVLSNEPFGLRIEQLTSMCRISAKTAKNILATIDVQEEHGVYSLSGATRAEIKAQPQPLPAEQPKAEQPKQVSTRVQAKAHEEILQYLHDFPEGLTKPELMAALQLNDKQFTNGIYKLNKDGAIIRTGKFGSYKYQLKTNGQEMNTEVIAAPAAEENVIQVQPVVETSAQDPQPSELDAIALLKDQVKTVVTRKSELTLQQDQLTELLSSIFGLDTVNFYIVGNIILSVHLCQEEVV